MKARKHLTTGFHPDQEAKAEAEAAFDDALMIKGIFRTTGTVYSRRGLHQMYRRAATREADRQRRKKI